MKRTISILMIAMMILTCGAFTSFGADAENPANVEHVAAYAGYGSVSVYWTPVSGAEKYIIYKGSSKAAVDTKVAEVKPGSYTKQFTSVKPGKVNGYDNNIPFAGYKYRDANNGKTAYYKVFAVKGGKTSVASPVSGSQRVEYITYDFVLKTNKKLTSHDGKKKTVRFKKGTKLTATGFGGGKFKFYYKVGGKSYYFYCNAISTKKAVAHYNRKSNYSRLSAQNYVNEWGYSSKTGYMIWASLYTQHIYIFKGSKGHWVCIKDFECSSGAARAASPSGAAKFLIKGPGTEAKPGKRAKRHNRKWWSPYSSWNSFHSKLPKQTLGYPASKGCIRCMQDDAYFIYKNIPVYTRVSVM